MNTNDDRRPKVDIALATYNGATYLPEFLRSLATQRWRPLAIVASDDASRDATPAILEAFDMLPVRVIRHDANQGVRRNFDTAIAATDAPYIFFADQDDYWEADKIDEMTKRIRAIEAERGTTHPVLVTCDLKIVDADLNEVESSYFAGTGKVASADAPKDYIISNHVPGCAMAINRALLEKAMPIPEGVYLHDWWFILVATIFGTVDHVPRSLIWYRQHGNNSVGFGGARQGLLPRLARYLRDPLPRARTRIAYYGAQARIVETNIAALRHKFGDAMPREANQLLTRLSSPHWLRRLSALQGAKTGESPVATLLITAQMWRQR